MSSQMNTISSITEDVVLLSRTLEMNTDKVVNGSVDPDSQSVCEKNSIIDFVSLNKACLCS